MVLLRPCSLNTETTGRLWNQERALIFQLPERHESVQEAQSLNGQHEILLEMFDLVVKSYQAAAEAILN